MLRQWIKLSSTSRCNENVISGIKHLHTTSRHLIEEKVQAKQKVQVTKTSEILDKYDIDQKQKILEIINNNKLEELLSYDISTGRANKLLSWRVNNGLLKNLNDIFTIEGFGPKAADKLFQSLLLERKKNDPKLVRGIARKSSFIIPTIQTNQKEAIKSSVSIRIGVNSVTWCYLNIPERGTDMPCLLNDWQHHEISGKKLHINELIQRCLHIHHLIPIADCYIFENPQIAQASNIPGGVEQQNINIQKSQVIAIMGYALASRKSEFDIEKSQQSDMTSKTLPNVFYIRRFLSARLFNRFVGTERVSSEDTILDLMRTFYNTNEVGDCNLGDLQQLNIDKADLAGSVQFPLKLREMFSQAPNYYREFLSQALLLNLAFVRLVLLEDLESIAKVSGGNKS